MADATDRTVGKPSSDFAALFDGATKPVVLFQWAVDGLPVHVELHTSPEDALDASRSIAKSDEWKQLANEGHYQTLTGHVLNKGLVQSADVVLFKRQGEAQVTWLKPKAAKPKAEAPATRRKPQAAKKNAARKPTAKKNTAKRTTANKRTPAKPRSTAKKTVRKPGRK